VKRARIIGTGSYLPEKILTNHDLEQTLDTSDSWIVTRTGIRERRIAAEGENTSDLAAKAGAKALEMAGVKPDEVDLIVVGTITGDFPWPATACMVQQKLGCSNAFAFDLSAACSGFVYALTTAGKYLESGTAKRALVIGAEVISRILDWEDRNTCVLFGDAAGAVVLEAQEGESGLLSSHLHSDGKYWDLLYQPGFGAVHPPTSQAMEERLQYLKMQGSEVFKVAVRMLSEVAQEALAAHDLSSEAIKLFIPHQANMRILEATAKRVGFAPEQVYINVDRLGNTSGATIPVALDEANRLGMLNEGDLILLDAFGGGFTWGASLVRW